MLLKWPDFGTIHERDRRTEGETDRHRKLT